MKAFIIAYEPPSVLPAFMICYGVRQQLRPHQLTDANRGEYRFGCKYSMADIQGFSGFLERDVLGQPITPKGSQRQTIDGFVNGLPDDIDPMDFDGVSGIAVSENRVFLKKYFRSLTDEELDGLSEAVRLVTG